VSSDAEAVVKEYAERLEAVRAELRKAESWGTHRTGTEADFASGRLGVGIRMGIRCPACGSWAAGIEYSLTKDEYAAAAGQLVLTFQEYCPEDCEEARRTNLVRDVMES
jgi:hypothetical protein